MWTFFGIVMAVVVSAIILLLRRYSSTSVSFIVQLATAYAWLTAMWVVALVPMDVYSTLTRKPESAISSMWDVSYWSTQVLTWLLLPFFQVYADAGDFTAGARCLTSLKENAILYGAAGVAGLIGLVLLLTFGKMNITSLTDLGMGLSNTFGLLAGLLLLGYGLVAIPRLFWKSNPEQLAKWCAHRAGRFADMVVKATKEMETVINIIVANKRQMARHDPLRPYMDVIMDFAEQESPVKPSHIGQVNFESLGGEELDFVDDVKSLANLRRRLFHAISEYKAAHTQYEEAILQAFEMDHICKARSTGDLTPPAPSPSAASSTASLPLLATATSGASPLGRTIWFYKVLVRPWSHKVLSACLAATSLVIIWCEVTIVTGVHPDLSPLSHVIRNALQGEASTQTLVLLPLAYICACTYFAMFSINAFNYNRLLPRATTGAALMQNGSLMCRFAAPTCWNFLHMIHMSGGGVSSGGDMDTVFSKKMGGMTLLPVLNKHLNVYAPAILVLHCAAVATGAWERVTSMWVPAKYKFSDDDTEDMYTEKGRELIRREQEAVARGFKVGEVLHASTPELAPATSAPKPARGLFSWLGGGRQNEEGRGSSGKFASSLAARRAEDPADSGSQRTNLLSSLVSNRHGTPSSSYGDSSSGAAAGASRASGLDGIFADLRPAGRSSAAPKRRATDDDESDPSAPMLTRWGFRR